MRNRSSKAFTLVEILIVVVILGILAAIVIPQFTNASQEAQTGNVRSQLQTLRGQIELFRVRNNGSVPVIDGSTPWSDMLAGTNNNAGLGTTNSFGREQEPYMRAAPTNPRNQQSTIEVVTGTVDPRATAAANVATATSPGWVYNTTTGALAAYGYDEATGTWVTTAGTP